MQGQTPFHPKDFASIDVLMMVVESAVQQNLPSVFSWFAICLAHDALFIFMLMKPPSPALCMGGVQDFTTCLQNIQLK